MRDEKADGIITNDDKNGPMFMIPTFPEALIPGPLKEQHYETSRILNTSKAKALIPGTY